MRRHHPQRIDKEATAAAGFVDPRSYCRRTRDTGELMTYRFGLDMQALRQKAFERSKGFCEMPLNGTLSHRCNRNVTWETGELHHSPSLANGGDDSIECVLFICRRCHIASHGRTTRFRRANAQV